ncbi:hypothetical protein SDC9_188413 [bioreactor metagenome]|uniref:Uncharacterized protein n=1 Tax=bioreactor metagenome TaxID=1076179 RepID=A0A645I015_9ZZZZ
MLQVVDLARQAFQAVERDRADLAVFQRDRVAGVMFGADAVEAEQLAGHLETGYLVAAVLKQHVGLEEAAADGVNGIETLAGTVEVIASFDAAAGRYQVVQPLQFLKTEPKRKA